GGSRLRYPFAIELSSGETQSGYDSARIAVGLLLPSLRAAADRRIGHSKMAAIAPLTSSNSMGQKIDRDHQRFRKIVRGKVKTNLSKYISRGELIGKKGRDLISIPLPQIEIPQFRYGQKQS